MQTQQEHTFEFTGDGWEYFRIWIVNLLLTILTLGIYSAWAKVRRLQYFYRNTRLAGASFDYHGLPMAILKGRLIAFALLAVYSIAGQLNPLLGAAIAILLALVMPWMIVRSLRFKLHNSSYRGLRFSFTGSDRDAYRVFLLFPILTALTAYLLAPFTYQRIKQFQHRNSLFGSTPFDFDASVGSFYGIFLKVLAVIVAIGVVMGLLGGYMQTTELLTKAPFILALFPVTFLIVAAYLAVSVPNLIWNSTRLGAHRFISRQQMLPYLWISFTNLLGIVCTLGLFVPFATIRMLRYKLENMGMLAEGGLTEFVAGQAQLTNAIGEEASEMFDIDISL